MSFFEPDRYFSRISAIDLTGDILERGFSHILLDIDNTILPRRSHDIPRDVALWLAKARGAGLVFCLVSNNWHREVHELAKQLELPIVSHAMKPAPPALLLAMRKIRAKRKSCLVIGDQLITDVLGAHFIGLKAYLVCPLVEQDLKHTLMLRNIERVMIGHLQPEGANCELRSIEPATGDGALLSEFGTE
ncbi:MAG: YqeG family HAD IIIA-type phosphatase, partial [Eggerthellaceae bacterium]|nr:YqeG family HAD IIIA-type phosphatase [Eggerthellaceae bacterium]